MKGKLMETLPHLHDQVAVVVHGDAGTWRVKPPPRLWHKSLPNIEVFSSPTGPEPLTVSFFPHYTGVSFPTF